MNIHALDPAIIAVTIALTKRSEEIDLIELLERTKYGRDGMGGLLGNGVMYVESKCYKRKLKCSQR